MKVLDAGILLKVIRVNTFLISYVLFERYLQLFLFPVFEVILSQLVTMNCCHTQLNCLKNKT